MLAATIAPGAFIVILLVELALPIWSLIDVSSRPDWAWQASGQSKTLWIVLNVIGLVFCGVVIGLIYLVGIRPKVAAAQRGAEGMGGTYGGGYGGTGYGGGSSYGGSSYGGSGYGAPAAGGTGYGWTPPPTAPPPSGTPSATSAPPPPAPSVPAGWYPDPAGGGGLRYWNGSAWTEDVRPG